MSLLPGLYLFLLAALLGWALRRWWDPVPLRVWAAFGAVLLLLLGPALFGGKVLLPLDILAGISPHGGARPARVQGNPLQSDLVTQVVPTLTEVRRQLRAGEWPLWNDLAGAGVPLMADPQAQVLQPLVFLALPLPLPQAAGVTAGLRVLTSLVFFFLLLRRQGVSEGPALFGSVSYGLCGFLLLWLGWPLANSAALLPAVLYGIAMVDERGARRDVLLLTVTAAAALTAGHPETVLYIGTVGALFAGARLLARPVGERGRLLGRWALAGGIALGLAVPAILPMVRYLPQTHRDRMVEIRNENLKKEPFLKEWRSPAREEALDRMARRVTPVFAPRAFGDHRSYWGSRNLNEDTSGFAGTAALLAALAAFVPGARRLRQERLFLGVAAASFFVLALPPGLPRLLLALPPFDRSPTFHQRIALVLAFSLAFLAACTAERWRRGEGRRVVAVVCTVVLGGLVLWGYQAWPVPVERAAVAPAVLGFSRGLQLGVLALAALALLWKGGRWTAGALAVVAVAELALFHGPVNPALPRDWYYPETPVLAFLRENAGDSRVAVVGGFLRPNALTVYGLADVRVSNPMKPYLYTEALAPVSRSVRDIPDMLTRPEHPLYRFLGVRYVVARRGTGARRGRSLRPVFRDRTAVVFQRRAALPRLFLQEVNPDSSELRLTPLRPAHLAASARLAEERLLASSVYQDGGWRLLVDGRPRETVLANGPFVGAWLPAGEHRADLLYRPPGFVAGMALAALAFAAAFVALTPRP